MKKTIIYLLLLSAIFSACEKDDFCIQNPVTSKLIIRFFDATNRETPKRVQNLYVYSEVNSDTIARYNNVTIDSIAIPLNPNALETVYNFSKNGVVNQFSVKYDIEEEYVSRSCGFKVIFNNVEFTSPNNTWFIDFTPDTALNLDDQTAAHVQVFH
ncbi:DUF6452 family protein [uncultured Polaribacter sp.]|uniref:DUF6452 family protein n=1 Tax=uncultured Polaribacter sp. TaxID=174711 RepID=UPI0026298678|nr:DUF6452 family protein [uncultured Polaribacter sp.]